MWGRERGRGSGRVGVAAAAGEQEGLAEERGRGVEIFLVGAAKGGCWFAEYSCCSCCCCCGRRLMTIQRSERLVEDSSEGLSIVHFEKKSWRCFIEVDIFNPL